MSKRVSFYIDGFNVYHTLKGKHWERNYRNYHKYLWLNYDTLVRSFKIPHAKDLIVKKIYYFTSLPYYKKGRKDQESLDHHTKFIMAQKKVGLEIREGKFEQIPTYCKLCQQSYTTPKEKRTDVNLAVHLLRDALDKEVNLDIAIIISSDSDLVPPIRIIKELRPEMLIGVAILLNNKAYALKGEAHFSIPITEELLNRSLFDDPTELSDGTLWSRPSTYK